jgi:hypothetical protein
MGAWIDAKRRDGIEPSKNVYRLYQHMEDQEKEATKMAKEIVTESPVWAEFFCRVNGIGERLSTSLMAEIQDISKFPTVSSLWAYCGMLGQYFIAKCSNDHDLIMSSDKHIECPVFDNQEEEPCGGKIEIVEKVEGKSPKRVKGYHYLFNTKLKTVCWKVTGQIVKQGDKHYRDIYDTAKMKYNNKAKNEGLIIEESKVISKKKKKDQPKYMSIGHIDNRAKRVLAKRILSDLWEAWRGCEGLEVKRPYVIEKLGHKGYVPWTKVRDILDREKGLKSKRKKKELVS